ncbi:hypothetical protein ACJX0J_027472 [Zea mays]
MNYSTFHALDKVVLLLEELMWHCKLEAQSFKIANEYILAIIFILWCLSFKTRATRCKKKEEEKQTRATDIMQKCSMINPEVLILGIVNGIEVVFHYSALALNQLPVDKAIMKRSIDEKDKHYHEDFVIDEDSRWLIQGWKGRIMHAVKIQMMMALKRRTEINGGIHLVAWEKSI